MAKKNPENLRFVDQAAQSAHDVVTQLHERAAQVEDELRQAATTVSGGSEEGTTLQLTDIEGTVRKVADYVQENPFAAAALALGAGAMLTSMYWDDFTALRGRRKASRRERVATVTRAKPATAPKKTKVKTKAKATKARKTKTKAPKAKARKAKARKAKARPK
jgi:ElaB/YqjD/DUF883 family membrane-anchored ribosome-binding protein